MSSQLHGDGTYCELSQSLLEKSRFALFQCASELVRLGQFQLASRICDEIFLQATRFVDGRNFFAAQRLTLLMGKSLETPAFVERSLPKFPFCKTTQRQFDLLCATEEFVSSRWENARIILESICESLSSTTEGDEYDSCAFGMLATCCRHEWETIERNPVDSKGRRALEALWTKSLQQAERASQQYPHERPRYNREQAWRLALKRLDSHESIVSLIEEGVSLCQQHGMVREEHECLQTWRDLANRNRSWMPAFPNEFAKRLQFLDRQFGVLHSIPSDEEIQLQWIEDELDGLRVLIDEAKTANQTGCNRQYQAQS